MSAAKMSVGGACHCGAVRIEVPGAPEWLASCNCSICRRTRHADGLLPRRRRRAVEGETAPYIWGDRMIALHHCPVCACVTHWVSTGESYGRVGVNARLLDGFAVTRDGPTFEGVPIEVRFMDNAGN